MAAFDFPNSPSVNDQHTDNGITFKWDGTVWKRVSATGAQGPTGSTGSQGATGPTGAQGQKGAQAYISDAAPSSGIAAGDLWWDSDSGDFSIYFNDGNSSEWIEVGSTGPTGPTGAQGATGSGGSTGAQGATGPTGAQGGNGAQGAVGATGAQGAAGAQGATGSSGSATLSNNADNRVITGGSGTNLVGESTLTYDGTTLSNTNGGANFTKSANNYVLVGSTNASGASLVLDGDSNGDGSGTDYAYLTHNTDGDLDIVVDNPANAGNIKFFTNSSTERLRITSTGALQHTPTSGVNYFTGTGEYVFGSATSSPPAGGNEANVQIHASKTRAQFSINAYMSGNAGGPFMQFVTSRSGTVGTLGGKVNSNDYLGEIRFCGDNGTNYNSLAHGATIWARAKSTPADGDTVIHGELNFSTGTTDGTDGVKDRLTIQESGRIKFHEDPVQRNSTVDNFSGDGAYMQHYVARTGSQYRRNLDIASVGDGSWGSSIRFSTNPDSNATSSERMRLNHNGELMIGGDYTQTTHRFLVDNGTTLFKDRVFVKGSMSFMSTPFGANVTLDTGISVNAAGYGGSILALCSRNYGSGTNTQAALYFIKFHYDGNNTPGIYYITGTNNFATFGQSGSNTLTVSMGASNNMFSVIESSVS